MEQYPVPQFIEEEARMTSFLTMRQFIYLVIAGAVIFVLYSVLPFFLFIIAAIIVGGGAASLAFFKINGVPLLTMIFNSIGFLSGAKAYTWKKKESLYPFKTIQRATLKKVEEVKLGVSQKSGLKKLKTKIELNTK